jgi:hypothetical protein
MHIKCQIKNLRRRSALGRQRKMAVVAWLLEDPHSGDIWGGERRTGTLGYRI